MYLVYRMIDMFSINTGGNSPACFFLYIHSSFFFLAAHDFPDAVGGQIVCPRDFLDGHAAVFEGLDVAVSLFVFLFAPVFCAPFDFFLGLLWDIDHLAFYVLLDFLEQVRGQNLPRVSVAQV